MSLLRHGFAMVLALLRHGFVMGFVLCRCVRGMGMDMLTHGFLMFFWMVLLRFCNGPGTA